jgi:hypothetical protein
MYAKEVKKGAGPETCIKVGGDLNAIKVLGAHVHHHATTEYGCSTTETMERRLCGATLMQEAEWREGECGCSSRAGGSN